MAGDLGWLRFCPRCGHPQKMPKLPPYGSWARECADCRVHDIFDHRSTHRQQALRVIPEWVEKKFQNMWRRGNAHLDVR